MIELVGYLGSALVLVSFLMTSVVRLRIVNMVGSLISCIYALVIGSYPLALMNFALILINLRFLWVAAHTSENNYALLPAARDDALLRFLLERYGEDIEKCFPGVRAGLDKADTAYLLLCDENPAGLVLACRQGESCEILLDYSLPRFRDYSLGRFLHGRLPREGIDRLIYRGPTENHQRYLARMGYSQGADGSWVCELK